MAKTAKKSRSQVAPVFEQIGFSSEESVELMRKSHLLDEVQSIVHSKGLTQKELAQRTGLGQPHVSELLRGRLSRFSVEKLISILEKLGATVEITVRRGA